MEVRGHLPARDRALPSLDGNIGGFVTPGAADDSGFLEVSSNMLKTARGSADNRA